MGKDSDNANNHPDKRQSDDKLTPKMTSKVDDEAKEKSHKAAKADGGAVERTERKDGGRVGGCEDNPFSSAAHGTRPPGHKPSQNNR